MWWKVLYFAILCGSRCEYAPARDPDCGATQTPSLRRIHLNYQCYRVVIFETLSQAVTA